MNLSLRNGIINTLSFITGFLILILMGLPLFYSISALIVYFVFDLIDSSRSFPDSASPFCNWVHHMRGQLDPIQKLGIQAGWGMKQNGERVPIGRMRPIRRTSLGWDCEYEIPTGQSFESLVRQIPEINSVVKGSVIMEERQKGIVQITVYRNNLPTKVDWSEIVNSGMGFCANFYLPILIGISRMGVISVDLAEAPHLLVAGTTGGGKSNAVKIMVETLSMKKLKNKNIKLYGIDLKRGIEFSKIKDFDTLAKNLEETSELLGSVIREMESRLDSLEQYGVSKLLDFHARYGVDTQKYPFIVLLLDELSELNPKEASDKSEKAIRETCMNQITRIAKLGRAAGIHLILATQRPDADVIPGQLRANISAVLCMRVSTPVQSRVVLGEGFSEASVLRKIPGRALFLEDSTPIEVQVPFLNG